IVEQFGLATMPGWPSMSSGLTWLTTSGTVGSIRQAELLSMTVAPRATAGGASSREASPPAEKRAMSTPSKASPVASSTSRVAPSIETVLPADRSEASRRRSPTGNSRSRRTWIIVRPTTPVAPTTATVRFWRVMSDMAPLSLSLAGHRGSISAGPFATRAGRPPRSTGPGRATAAEAWRAGGSSARSGLLRGDRPLGEVAIHRRLARQVDPPLAIDLHDDDHHLVADGHDVLDGRHVVVGELADPDEALLARQDLDKGAETHDPGDLAEVQRPDLDLAGEALDPLDRLAGVLAGGRSDLDRAVVLDVDLGLGLFVALADHRAAL